MSNSLYEQFLAVGSVKSLLTGKEYFPEIAQSGTNHPIKTEDTSSDSSPQTNEH